MSSSQDLARNTLRTSVTKTSKKIQELVKEDVVDQDALVAQFELLKVRYEELSLKDQEAMEIMYQSEKEVKDIESEQDKIDSYATKFFKCKSLVDSALHKVVSETRAESVSNVSESTRQHKYKLPVLKLKEFDGTLSGWLPFWSQFQKIHEDEEMHAVDKLGYLSMSMTPGSPARRLVDSYPATGEMYSQVVEALKERFGRDDLLTEFYIRELLKLVIQNAGNKKLPLASLYDHIQCHIRNLETLGVTSKNCAAILMPLVSSCLPSDLLQIWERSSTSHSNIPQDCLDNLLQFLRNEVEGSQKLELVADFLDVPSSNKSVQRKERYNVQKESIPTASGLVNLSNEPLCIFCSGKHKSQDCLVKQSVEERQKCVRENHVCFCCLKHGHRAAQCRNRPKCTKCGRRHFTIMCVQVKEESTKGASTSEQVTLSSSTVTSSVLMQTLVVRLNGNNGKTKLARLLIDTGSQHSYILSKSARELGYRPTHTEKIQHALFGGGTTDIVECNAYKVLVSSLNDSYYCDFTVLNQDTICNTVPTVPEGPWLTELHQSNIELTDVGHATTDIEILVGADVVGKLYTGRLKELSSGLVAVETHLGWTLCGKVPSVENCKSTNLATLVTSLLVASKDKNISDLWELDTLGIRDPVEKISKQELEKAAHEHFLKTVKVNDDGRFEVHYPFFKDHPPLTDNLALSLKRLESTIKKLKREGHEEAYAKVLQGWKDQGIIEEVPPHEREKPAHYLPHHPVIKSNSTTPVRPVFDASAKEFGKCSLNECLESGPNLLEKIPAALAKFREKRVGISSDIAQAFLQISVTPNDRDFLRFLWRDEHGELQVLRHCRVLFGASPSPFLLEACIALHVETLLTMCSENKCTLSVELLSILKDSFYVDNCLTSLNSVEQAEEFINLASSVMSNRGFNLRGWEKSGDCDEKLSNILGLVWNKKSDTLTINIDRLISMKPEIVTKKVLLSAAHRLFDPIGMVSSVALVPKILVQETWKQNLSWNAEVDETTKEKFEQWLKEIHLLQDVYIPRWIADNDFDYSECQVHVFTDACKSSYAACVFLHIENSEGVTLRVLASDLIEFVSNILYFGYKNWLL
ncbi:uncharacterized protein LOC103521977 [Diaphorina citri]|uniref:Uncharacterized protein LOC103521977 n=1 Tax=Diaphorina citri TaxID=121845 RepID=A0A1S3DNF9_DIACI|nr:uncharacterized protein LOC103521977 [Diaphorina citri]